MPAEHASDPALPFITVTNWIRAAAQCGIDLVSLLQSEGLDPSQLHPDTATIHRDALQRIMSRCVELTRASGQPKHFPIVLGESFAFEYLSDIETFITTSPTLREATRALEWLPPLINPSMAFSLGEQGAQARIILRYDHPDASTALTWHFTEAIFTTTLKFSRLLLGPDALQNGHISLRHAPHGQSALLSDTYQLPVEYNAPIDAIWFERSMLDRPLPGAIPALHEIAAQRIEHQLAQRRAALGQSSAPAPRHPQAQAVIDALKSCPDLLGQGVDAIAHHLGMHPRTLQRRLRDAGISVSAIQDQLRLQSARQLLADTSLSIEEISARLGYTERRSFTQAFTRWTGHTPSRYRRRIPPDN